MNYQSPNNVVIRSGDGRQFIAENVREYLGLYWSKPRIYTYSNTRRKCSHRGLSRNLKEYSCFIGGKTVFDCDGNNRFRKHSHTHLKHETMEILKNDDSLEIYTYYPKQNVQ
jgi:hypothetical protein